MKLERLSEGKQKKAYLKSVKWNRKDLKQNVKQNKQ